MFIFTFKLSWSCTQNEPLFRHFNKLRLSVMQSVLNGRALAVHFALSCIVMASFSLIRCIHTSIHIHQTHICSVLLAHACTLVSPLRSSLCFVKSIKQMTSLFRVCIMSFTPPPPPHEHVPATHVTAAQCLMWKTAF